MSWKPFTVQVAASASVGTGIAASLRKRGKSEKPAKLALTLKANVVTELGWDAKTPLVIMLGADADHGMIRLMQVLDDQGGIQMTAKQTAKGAWFELMLGHVDAFVDRAETKKWCQWEKLEDGTGLEIVLPSWAEETAPRDKSRVSLTVDLAETKQPISRREALDRVGSIAGDPPPGRSALDMRGRT